MITVNQLKGGLGDFLQTQLMPRLDGKRQFLLGTLYALSVNKMDALVAQLAQNDIARALGIVAPNGEIDIDVLYNAAYAQMQTQGKLKLDVPLLGSFAFDENDLRELRECIMRRSNT